MLMREVWRGMVLGRRRMALRFFAALAGASVGTLGSSCLERCACVGFVASPPQLVNSFILPQKLHVGDTLHFTAQTDNHKYEPADMRAIIRSERIFAKEQIYSMRDDGRGGDSIRGDGQWVLDLVWTPEMPKGRINARIELHAAAYGNQPGCSVQLVVEPKE